MLVAYTNGLDLIRALRPIVETIRSHSSEMAKQVERAGSSIMQNIGEGSYRIGRDPRRFYAMAQGSAAEIRAALDTCDAWGWNVDTSHARALLGRELGLLWGLTHPKARNGQRTQ
jgi:four helix bundle protein